MVHVSDWRLAGALAGAAAPAALLVVLVAVTITRWSFLRANGWSVTRRNDVGWPSILTLGDEGWIVSATFVVCGIFSLLFAAALYAELPPSSARIAAVLLGFVGAALVVVALPPDAPGEQLASWHNQVHNFVYPVIPLASIAAAAFVAAARLDGTGWAHQAPVAVAMLCVLVPSFLLTGVDAVGQLARYVLFGALMVWFEVLALSLFSALRAGNAS